MQAALRLQRSPTHALARDNGDVDAYVHRRQEMVRRDLAARGITDVRVLAAMGKVPREEFVPVHLRERAYADCPLPLGRGQTISQPFVVALTAQLACIEPHHRILDVGAGSGYAAAVYSLLAGEVVAVEILAQLATGARAVLALLGYHVRVIVGDAHAGVPDAAPFDAIISAAAAPEVPAAWRAQVRPGGRIVAPVGPRLVQELEVHQVDEHGTWTVSRHGAVRYVPLVSHR